MKKGVTLQLTFTNRWLYTFLFIAILSVTLVFVVAYNSDFLGGVPSVMGHSSDEVMVDINGSSKSLQQSINDGDFGQQGTKMNCDEQIAMSDGVTYTNNYSHSVIAQAFRAAGSGAGSITGQIRPDSGSSWQSVMLDGTDQFNSANRGVTFVVPPTYEYRFSSLGGGTVFAAIFRYCA
jgi:hypothetical protein